MQDFSDQYLFWPIWTWLTGTGVLANRRIPVANNILLCDMNFALIPSTDPHLSGDLKTDSDVNDILDLVNTSIRCFHFT